MRQKSINWHIGPPSLARPANKFPQGRGFCARPHGRARRDGMNAVMAGFQHHVAKPAEPAELIAMVASQIRRVS
jgi:hypothetical protein